MKSGIYIISLKHISGSAKILKKNLLGKIIESIKKSKKCNS